MNKLKMKAKAGVTLIELLVVVLIVVVLSVSLLPLLQPFVTEAQYAAEAIPVIGNLRTKIGLYQYDKGELPGSSTNNTECVQTWAVSGGAAGGANDSELFVPCQYKLPIDVGGRQIEAVPDIAFHVQRLIDVDYQDLKGTRSKPTDYHYYSISSVSNLSYVVGCFGSGNKGLKAGTGYAVCELNYPSLGKKYIGTWKCYKPVDENNGPIHFISDVGKAIDPNTGRPVACYVPDKVTFENDLSLKSGEPAVIGYMRTAGWEF